MGSIKVTLLNLMGEDIDVVNAARVSFDKESHWAWPGPHLNEKDASLVRYLADHNHWSPFSHCFASFRISGIPIAVARQLQKHTVGLAWNEVSRRYVDEQPMHFRPEKWRWKADNVKQGSGEEIDDPDLLADLWSDYEAMCEAAETIYSRYIERGVCAEQMRFVLLQSMETSWIWSGSLMAFARVCNLRLDPHTQKETRDVAALIADYMEFNFPASWAALTEKKDISNG